MQFRLTLSEDDLVQSKILAEMGLLNHRRRSEYLRRLLSKGYLVELDEIEKINAMPERVVSKGSKSKGKSSTGSGGVDALRGIFSGQANDETKQ